jgi:hypothetical protein
MTHRDEVELLEGHHERGGGDGVGERHASIRLTDDHTDRPSDRPGDRVNDSR